MLTPIAGDFGPQSKTQLLGYTPSWYVNSSVTFHKLPPKDDALKLNTRCRKEGFTSWSYGVHLYTKHAQLQYAQTHNASRHVTRPSLRYTLKFYAQTSKWISIHTHDDIKWENLNAILRSQLGRYSFNPETEFLLKGFETLVTSSQALSKLISKSE